MLCVCMLMTTCVCMFESHNVCLQYPKHCNSTKCVWRCSRTFVANDRYLNSSQAVFSTSPVCLVANTKHGILPSNTLPFITHQTYHNNPHHHCIYFISFQTTRVIQIHTNHSTGMFIAYSHFNYISPFLSFWCGTRFGLVHSYNIKLSCLARIHNDIQLIEFSFYFFQ